MKNLTGFLDEQRHTSLQILGSHERHYSYLNRIVNKVVAIHFEPSDSAQVADLLLLTFDLAWRCGLTPTNLIEMTKTAGESRTQWANETMRLMQEILNESGVDKRLYHPDRTASTGE